MIWTKNSYCPHPNNRNNEECGGSGKGAEGACVLASMCACVCVHMCVGMCVCSSCLVISAQ